MNRRHPLRSLSLSYLGQPVLMDTGRIPLALQSPHQDRSAPLTCVLLHGAMNDHRVWRLQARALARSGVPVIAPDWPGHGQSGGSPLPHIEAMAQWLVGLLDALGVGPVVLAGHSMGSLAALEAAARLGERARALVLVGTAAPMKVAPALLEMAAQDPASAIGQIAKFSVAMPKAMQGQTPPPEAAVRRAKRIGQGLTRLMHENLNGPQGAGLLHTDLSACDQYAGALLRASELRAPTFVVSGSLDKMTPAKASTELQQVLGERLVQTPLLASGHSLMAEQPWGVLQALRLALEAAHSGASA